MPPTLWKIAREFRRLGRRLKELPEDTHTYFFATRRYDRTLAKQVRHYQGHLAASPRAVIYLIYPSQGLLPSHLEALGYFHAKGYAVHVVSNLPLQDAEREQLLTRCTSYLERPNFGYDFGGYRDGILKLAPQFGTLERLVLMNDSTWFPLPGSRDWLDDVEALDVDFAGAISNYGVGRINLKNYRTAQWHYRPGNKRYHYCSFALCLRQQVLRDPAFVRFWQHLRLTDKKGLTTRRGEIGFSQWAFRRGYSHAATFDLTRLDQDLATLSTPRLFGIARALVILENRPLMALKAEILAGTPTREDLIGLILTTVTRQGAAYALADYAVEERGYGFLKKSPAWMTPETAALTQDLAARLAPPFGPLILGEARALQQQHNGLPA